MIAAYLKVNQEARYVLAYVGHWIGILRMMKDVDIYIICDKESLRKMLLTTLDLHDVRFLISNRSSPELRYIVQNAIDKNWHFAAYAHLTTFEHSVRMKYDEFWNIDADDTEICVPSARAAYILTAVREYARRNHIQIFSLDMWRTALLGKHWSFGVTYTSNATNWLRLMEQHCRDEKFQKEYSNVSSGKNVDWFVTYLKSICDIKIETFCVENMWFNHHSNFLYRQVDFGLTYFRGGRKVFPTLIHYYGMKEQSSLPIAKDVIQFDIGLAMEENMQYLRECSFSKELIHHCIEYSSQQKKSKDADGDDSGIAGALDEMMPEKDILYVICPYNIGDFLINGGLCYALQILKRKKTCVLIVCDKFKNSGLGFVGVMQIVYIPQEVMDEIRNYIIRTGQYDTDRYVYGHFHVESGCFLWDKELCFFDRYRKNVFGLPLETEILAPIISGLLEEEGSRLHTRYKIDSSTIVLAPYANSGPQIFSDTVWAVIAERLKELGYTVYTNVAGEKELPVAGTLPLRLDFTELAWVAGQVKCFIGRRSGIMDFLSFCGAEILCILYPEVWHDDLRLNFPGHESKAFYYAGHYKGELASYAVEHHVDMKLVQMDFPRVDEKEVYYEDEAMANAIVAAVYEQ